MNKKQNSHNTQLNDGQFADYIKSIAAIWSLMNGNFTLESRGKNAKLLIEGFKLKEDHPLREKTKRFFDNVRSESGQETARKDARELKQALLGLLRKFFGGHVNFFDNELTAALCGVNDYLWDEYAQGSDSLFKLIQCSKWDAAINKRIEKRRAEIQDGTTKLRTCEAAEDFIEFVVLQNSTVTFMKSICTEMKGIAGKAAAQKISEAARKARENPETVGKQPKKQNQTTPEMPKKFNPALAELLSSVV